MFSKYTGLQPNIKWWDNFVQIWNTIAIQDIQKFQSRVNSIIESHELNQVNTSEKKAIYSKISNIINQEWNNLDLHNLSEEITTDKELSKIRRVHVFELTQEQNLPYLKINWRHNDIVSLLYFYNFFDLTKWVSIENLLNEIKLWNFDSIILYLDSKIELLENLIKNDPKKAFLYAKEFPEIIKIINSLLIKPWKKKENLPWIQSFVEYLEKTLWIVIALCNESFPNSWLEEDKDSAYQFENLNLLLQFEALKLSRNYAKQISYKGTNTLDEINSVHNKIIALIKDTNDKISEIVSDWDEQKNQNVIWKILNFIAIIQKYEYIINKWIKINNHDIKIIKGTLHKIFKLAGDKIDIKYITNSSETFLMRNLEISEKLEEKNIELEDANTELKAANIELKDTNKKLKNANKKLKDAIKKLEDANIDVLTQVPNRKAHEEQLKETIAKLYPASIDRRNKRNNKPQNENAEGNENIQLKHQYYLLLDIDHFKKVNDTYWHVLWDSILKHFAQLLKKSIRKEDSIFRYWGEEFAILTEPTTLEWIKVLAKKINNIIENTPYIDKDKISYPITVSIWISEFSKELCEKDNNWEDVIKKADQALYNVKQSWRNNFKISGYEDIWIDNKDDNI